MNHENGAGCRRRLHSWKDSRASRCGRRGPGTDAEAAARGRLGGRRRLHRAGGAARAHGPSSGQGALREHSPGEGRGPPRGRGEGRLDAGSAACARMRVLTGPRASWVPPASSRPRLSTSAVAFLGIPSGLRGKVEGERAGLEGKKQNRLLAGSPQRPRPGQRPGQRQARRVPEAPLPRLPSAFRGARRGCVHPAHPLFPFLLFRESLALSFEA